MARPRINFPRRGEVYWAQLDKQRPVLILSADAINRSALDVCVVPLTTVERPAFTLRVPIAAGDGGLKQRSWAKCDQVTTIEKALLRRAAGEVSPSVLASVEQAVRLALQLE